MIESFKEKYSRAGAKNLVLMSAAVQVHVKFSCGKGNFYLSPLPLPVAGVYTSSTYRLISSLSFKVNVAN